MGQVLRDQKGRWSAGNPGSPGRPAREQDERILENQKLLMDVMRSVIDEEALRKLVTACFAYALKGSARHMQIILERFAGEVVELSDSSGERPVKFSVSFNNGGEVLTVNRITGDEHALRDPESLVSGFSLDFERIEPREVNAAAPAWDDDQVTDYEQD